MEIPFKGALTKKEYLHTIRLSHGRLSSAGEMGMSIDPRSLFVPIGAGLVVIGLWQGAGNDEGTRIIWIVLFVIGIGLMALGAKLLATPSRQWKQFEPLYAQREGKITEEAVEVRTLVDETRLSWGQFIGYGEHRGVIALFSCDIHYVPFSKRLFRTEAHWQAFRALVAQKLEVSHRVRTFRDYLKWSLIIGVGALAGVIAQVLIDAVTDTPMVGYVAIDMLRDPMNWRRIASSLGKTDLAFLAMAGFLTGGMMFITVPVLIYARDPTTIRSWFADRAETDKLIARSQGLQDQVRRLRRLGFAPLAVKLDKFPLWADKTRKLVLVSQEADTFAFITLTGARAHPGLLTLYTPFVDGGFVLTANSSWFPDAEQDGVSVKTVPLDDPGGVLHAHSQRVSALKEKGRIPAVKEGEGSGLDADRLFYDSEYCRRWFHQRLRQRLSLTAVCFLMLLFALVNVVVKLTAR